MKRRNIGTTTFSIKNPRVKIRSNASFFILDSLEVLKQKLKILICENLSKI